MDYDVRIETITERRPLAVVRRRAHKQDLPKVIPEACGFVWNALRAKQIKGVARHIAIYLDCEINVEVGVEMETPFDGDGEFVGSSIPTGLVASTVHFGPYPKLHAAHTAIPSGVCGLGRGLLGPRASGLAARAAPAGAGV